MATTFGEVTGRRLADIIRCSVFNDLKVNVDATAIRYRDTVADYEISTEQKLNKEKRQVVAAYIAGVVACWKSF